MICAIQTFCPFMYIPPSETSCNSQKSNFRVQVQRDYLKNRGKMRNMYVKSYHS